ncbi:MAG: methyltransferase domain-containing protein [Pseudonocardia sp.]|nr:methyltransferase domain-containing protein [Pseudonocardia sp.]
MNTSIGVPSVRSRSDVRPPETAGSDNELPADDGVVRRTLRAEVSRARARRGERLVRVLDVGGGSGVWAVPLAADGCAVTVVDTSPNALAALRGRAARAGVADRVVAVQGDVHSLAEAVRPAEADLVLGHGLLEVVDDAIGAVAQLAASVTPGGAVSLLVAGRHAAAFTQAHAGRLAQARAVLTDPSGRWGPGDPLQRRLDMAVLRRLLEAVAGLSIERVQGDGVLEGLLPSSVVDADPGGVEELESLVAGTPELLVLAARLHVIARRSECDRPRM